MISFNDINTTWLLAGGAGIAAFYQQIRSLFSWVSSLFIVSVGVNDEYADYFLWYLQRNAKSLPFGKRRYSVKWLYVKSLGKQTNVLFKEPGQNQIFICDKLRPILVNQKNNDSSNGDSPKSLTGDNANLTISFFRGTFDLDKNLYQAKKDFIEYRDNNKNKTRHTIQKVFGSIGARSETVTEKWSIEQSILHIGTPIGYKLEDIGYNFNTNPFKNLAYPQSITKIITYLENWIKNKDWYFERGIPWRIGALFYGLPGSGKTSYAKAIAEKLDLPIYVFDLQSMTNQDLTQEWRNCRDYAPCIILLEDIDRLKLGETVSQQKTKDKGMNSFNFMNRLSLDCLLNCISGVEPSDGIFVIATANETDNLDPALGVPDKNGKSSRPGRLDLSVYFGTLEVNERIKIAKRILGEDSKYIQKIVKEGNNETGAQFTKRCSELALTIFHEENIIKDK